MSGVTTWVCRRLSFVNEIIPLRTSAIHHTSVLKGLNHLDSQACGLPVAQNRLSRKHTTIQMMDICSYSFGFVRSTRHSGLYGSERAHLPRSTCQCRHHHATQALVLFTFSQILYVADSEIRAQLGTSGIHSVDEVRIIEVCPFLVSPCRGVPGQSEISQVTYLIRKGARGVSEDSIGPLSHYYLLDSRCTTLFNIASVTFSGDYKPRN